MRRVVVGTLMAALIAAPAFALTVSDVDTDVVPRPYRRGIRCGQHKR
jgi:hypothetical protein